ncbi:MAG: OB-fold nucleic acid binding domain-containing protein, partial [Bacteroidota bacterium]
KLKNKEIAFAGIVTSAEHRMTKTGKPFGVMFIEDFSGSFELAIFGDDYLKHRNFMEKEYFLYIKAKVQARFGDENKLEVKISSMKMLPDLGNSLAKGVIVNLELKKIDQQTIEDMVAMTQRHPGKLPLRFVVRNEDQKVEMLSKTLKVNFNNDLFNELDQMVNVSYRIEN